ncbi:unnamed protein product [Allacma fusca]|uniref:Uncharacterized protein n=1 Tax=Allacma fusca TaxID=39272 RepID=A0A8J2J6T6_9HEXA|nr:unnamed protein product [Allacma fusca]
MLSAKICCQRAPQEDELFVVELDAETAITSIKEENRTFDRLNTIMLSVLFAMFALSFLAVMLMMVWILFPDIRGVSAEVCETNDCKMAGRLLLSTMDTGIDPCEDFYQFACGNLNWSSNSYLDHTTLNRQRTLVDLIDATTSIGEDPDEPAAVIQMKIFYDSCVTNNVSASTIVVIRQIIDDLVPSNETIGSTLGRIKRLTGQSYIVGLSIGPDFKNTSERRIFIDQPELVVPKAILLDPAGDQYTASLYTSMSKIWLRVFHDFPEEKVNETFRQILDLETAMARAMTNEDERTKPGMFNLVSLDGINDLFSKRQALEDPKLENGVAVKTPLKLDWIEYVRKIFENITLIHRDTIVNVKDVQYAMGLAEIVSKTSVNRLRNYLRWHLLYTFASDLLDTASLMDSFETQTKLKHARIWRRELQCIQLMDTLLPFALSYNYIIKRSPQGKIKEAENILKNIVFSFQEMVAQSSWMEPGTKLKAIKKAGNVRAFLGYPKWLRSEVELDQYYNGLEFRDLDFIHNTLEALKWVSEKDLKDYNSTVDIAWSGTNDSPTEVDAFYDDELNSITIPLGFLQQPFVGMGLRALDYGALGFFIGHELIHGFDTEGRYSDENGSLSSWWTSQTLENFNSKTNCIQEQYSEFFVPEVNLTVNGEQTLKENIADNGGLEQAFRAYHLYTKGYGPENLTLPGLEKFSSEQLFFLSFAQSWCSYVSPMTLLDMVRSNEHSPPKFRVWGSISNLQAFSTVWQCKNNSRMNPSMKCLLW